MKCPAAVIAMTAILTIPLTGPIFSQGRAQVLDRPFPYNIERTEGPIPTMLEFLQVADLSGGIVLMTDCGDTVPLHFTANQGSTFRQVLDGFQTANPTYHWEMRGDALNMVPTARIPPLLAVTVNFDLQTTNQRTTVGEALAMFQDLPEIRQAAASLHLSKGMYAGGPEPIEDSARNASPEVAMPINININLKSVPLQDALNAVVEAYGHTMWIYEQRTCNGQVTYKIDESQIK